MEVLAHQTQNALLALATMENVNLVTLTLLYLHAMVILVHLILHVHHLLVITQYALSVIMLYLDNTVTTLLAHWILNV
jgi:hypothetical protein